MIDLRFGDPKPLVNYLKCLKQAIELIDDWYEEVIPGIDPRFIMMYALMPSLLSNAISRYK